MRRPAKPPDETYAELPDRTFRVRDTEVRPTDTPQEYRQKLARIVLDELCQFAGLLSTDGRVLEFNAASLELAGASRADVINRPFWECFWFQHSQHSQAQLREAIARAAKGEAVRYDVELSGRADGTRTLLIDLSLLPVSDHDGNVVYLVSEGRDITEKKAQELRIAQNTAVSDALYRVATSFANELDQQKLLQLVTDEATALTGAEFGSFFFNDTREDGNAYLLHTLSGAPAEAFSKFPMPRATPIFAPTFRGEGVIRSADIRKDPRYGQWGPQPKGHLPVVSYLAVPVVGRRGEVHGGLFFGHAQPGRFTEVHERIVHGLAAHAAVALEKTRLIKALRESEARAREADRRKDEFLAMLGHELRNPLAPISTALDLMKLRGDPATDREQQMIDRQVRHLTRLVDDLLDIARVTRGKIQIDKQRVELGTVIEKAVELASPLFEQRHHQLRLDVPRLGLPVDADPGRLAQVITNLLTNAAKYTEPGGSILLRANQEDGHVAISIRDNGQGISPELLSQIFELFVQGERTLDRAQGGLGIGLALVRNLVELHGGTVEAKSDGPGRGSEFVIQLPLSSGPAHTAPAPRGVPTPALPTRPGSRILVVDDNVDAAEALADILRAKGHEVTVAHDGPRALAVAETFGATAALLDIGLPVMDGYELARRLRELWTGRQSADRERALASGFDAHLVKPVDFFKLMALIETFAQA